MALIGGIIGAVGQLAQASAQRKASNYQAAVAENNRKVAELNATYEEQAGQVEEQAQRIKTTSTLGRAKAIQGASGFDVGSKSFADVRGTIASLGELDARTIRANAARRAYGYRTQGTNFGAEAELSRMQGRAAMLSGIFGAASSIIGGASSVSDKWSSFKYSPMTSGSEYHPTPLLSVDREWQYSHSGPV